MCRRSGHTHSCTHTHRSIDSIRNHFHPLLFRMRRILKHISQLKPAQHYYERQQNRRRDIPNLQWAKGNSIDDEMHNGNRKMEINSAYFSIARFVFDLFFFSSHSTLRFSFLFVLLNSRRTKLPINKSNVSCPKSSEMVRTAQRTRCPIFVSYFF